VSASYVLLLAGLSVATSALGHGRLGLLLVMVAAILSLEVLLSGRRDRADARRRNPRRR